MHTITRSPAELVNPRLLAAEATASAALALVQSPAAWAGLTTMMLLIEAHEDNDPGPARSAALAEMLTDAMVNSAQAATSVTLLEMLDHAARNWGAIAHPDARIGIAAVPVLGVVR